MGHAVSARAGGSTGLSDINDGHSACSAGNPGRSPAIPAGPASVNCSWTRASIITSIPTGFCSPTCSLPRTGRPIRATAGPCRWAAGSASCSQLEARPSITHGSLLQCREAGFRTGLAVGLYGSVSVSQIESPRDFREFELI